jgi:putative methyltransferase (TIGR04325 family)
MSYVSVIKEFLPPVVARKLSGLFYGWHGRYRSWETAKAACTGYDTAGILAKVRGAALRVRDGEAAFERDSVLFDAVEYSFPVLSALLWIAHENSGEISLIDFGGSLGSSYFQNRNFLRPLRRVSWNVVEQPHFVAVGNEEMANDQLRFYLSLDDCLREERPDTIILSSVIQYIEKPYELLDRIIEARFKYVIIDRTPFLAKSDDRITIQKVHPAIYQATYPCWFFNKKKFVDYLSAEYEVITQFAALDRANIKSDFMGFIFKCRN